MMLIDMAVTSAVPGVAAGEVLLGDDHVEHRGRLAPIGFRQHEPQIARSMEVGEVLVRKGPARIEHLGAGRETLRQPVRHRGDASLYVAQRIGSKHLRVGSCHAAISPPR